MVTIKDVAADAGVARSTVSYVLSGNKKLPEATRQKVLRSVSRLGYRPDPMARALALKRTNIVGLLATINADAQEADIDVFMRFVRAAMYEASTRGFDLLMMGKGEDELRGDVLADALVVMDVRREDPRFAALAEVGLPTVLIGYPGERTAFSSIDLDFFEAGRVAATHLIDLGHTQIAVLGASGGSAEPRFGFEVRFQEGFLEVCADREVRGEVIPFSSGAAGASEWLSRAERLLPELSAIITHGPGALDFVFERLTERGVSVPRDCSIVTVSPESVMEHATRPLTVIDLPGNEIVRRAVNLALDELAGIATPGVVELLPAVLHDHGTTAQHIAGRSGTVFAPLGAV